MRFEQSTKRIKQTLIAAAAAVFMAAWAAPTLAQASVPINEEEHINNSLLSAAVGALIRDNCPTIGARMFRVFRKTVDLKNYALDKGYTEDEIDAFISSKTEKQRMRKLANDYLAANGVVVGNEQSYCALGRAEIAKRSLTGYLLRAW